MAIGLSKILSMRAKDYVGSGIDIKTAYKIVGIHCDLHDIKEFAKLVPDDAEVVVDYHHELSRDPYSFHHQYGVALIPRPGT